MTDSTTTNYGWAYPTVNADADTWGTTLNNAIIAIDTAVKAVETAAPKKASNLGDLANAVTARTNLGLGSAATQATTAFVAAGAALLVANNLSDLANTGTARTSLGLGSMATKNITVLSTTPTGSGNTGDLWIQI